MKKLLFGLALFLVSFLWGQNRKIDSLLILIKADQNDTNKVNHLNKLSNEFRLIGDFSDGLNSAKEAFAIALKQNPINRGVKKGIANSYNYIGIAYWNQGNYPEALKNLLAALKIQEEIKDKQGIALSFNNIGNVYYLERNFSKALETYLVSLKLRKEIGDKQGIADTYNNIGNIYTNLGNYEEALKNYFASLDIKKEISDIRGFADCYNNIGYIYEANNNYEEALNNYLAALRIAEKLGDKQGISSYFINLGALYTKLNKLTEAQNYLDNALRLSLSIGSKEGIKESYSDLVLLDSAKGNFKTAFEHHKMFIIYRDSLNNEESRRKTIQSSLRYEFEKKEVETKAEHDKKEVIAEAERKKQTIFFWLIFSIAIAVSIVAFVVLRSLRITRRQKTVIEKQKQLVDVKQKEILDSIHYASRIQRALITSDKYIAAQLRRLMKNG